MVGSAWPTFSVAGMNESGTRRRNLIQAVVVAKEPMPRVSKKLVMKPRPTIGADGNLASVAGEGSRPTSPRTAATARAQPAM